MWRELAELTMTRVIVFNARRGSEIIDLTLNEFDTATSDFDPAISATLTPFEKQLLARYVHRRSHSVVKVFIIIDNHIAKAGLLTLVMLWYTKKLNKVGHASSGPPKSTFRNTIFHLLRCWPLKFLYPLETDQGLLAHTPNGNGSPKTLRVNILKKKMVKKIPAPWE